MITVKIDVSKIDKSKLYKGAKGTYLDVVLFENKGGTDEYGNDYVVCQSVSKEEREKGVKGAILGNAKKFGGGDRQQRPTQRPARHAPPTDAPADDDGPPF